ncbi:MAG: NADH:flavin oxidoreductase/NADH oxidase [Planctomycetales bacterium]|nr:NADH:flavin oxidoreductase/NADH oxidase [bacterium]UNM08089.1 MAG: NADH:flavin oxidoreductase/NADH oxidase [Planctomycetales bacterium]
MPQLFEPLELRSVTLRNRIGMSPMCMYSCDGMDGMPNAWHLSHLGSRAAGGCSLIIAEASAVEPEGRISPQDAGIWNDEQAAAWTLVAAFIESQGAVPSIQIAHAGRKAGTKRPSDGRGIVDEADAWQAVAPSAVPFDAGWRIPHELTVSELATLKQKWVDAALRAQRAGFKLLEVHNAHGYLLHSFLSPLSNLRSDEYGGSRENRMRFPLEVVEAVRAVWPDELPLAVRISGTDWHPDGWTVDDSVAYARELKQLGVDIIDCSSGGNIPKADIPVGPGYQVHIAERVRSEAGIPTMAVGMITEAQQAEDIIASGRADMVLLARELLREPYWAIKAARELQAQPAWPYQYGWAVGG